MSHAVLSPSSAERWLNCTPSARFEEQFPDRSSSYADEGTLAHRLGELFLREKLGRVKKHVYNTEFDQVRKHELFSNEMLDHCENYAVYVIEQYAGAQAHTKDAQVFLEQKLDLTSYVEDGFGTGDSVIIANGVLDIIDLKYGKGVPVYAENNRQMMLYGLGAMLEFEHLYDIETVRVTIFQPRLDSISTWEISAADLRKWAETELKPRATLAFAGTGEFIAGKHCQFCKARGACKANADFNLELAKYDFASPAKLADEEVSDILDRAKTFQNWLGDVEEYALSEAVERGKKWPGYKLVEGRSNRKYTDDDQVAETLIGKGYKEETIFTKKLLGITAMEKELGKNTFNTLLSPLITKPLGKPTLVPLSDKRPELNSTEAAKADFANVETD